MLNGKSVPAKKPKLVSKLAAGIVLLSILGILGIGVLTNTIVRSIIYDNVVGIVQRDVTIYATEIDTMFNEGLRLVRNLSLVLDVLGSEEDFQNVISSLVHEYDFVTNIFIAFRDGRVLNGIEWDTPAGWDMTTRPWYVDSRTVGMGNVVTTTPFASAVGDAILTSISVWIPDLLGEDALVGIIISVDTLVKSLDRHYLPYGGYLILADSDGYIIAHPTNPRYNPTVDSVRTNLSEIPYGNVIADIVESGMGIARFENFMGEWAYFIGETLPSAEWVLAAILPVSVTDSLVRRHITRIMFVFALFTLLILGITAAVSVRFTKNIAEKDEEISTLSNIFTKVSPLVMNIWDENINLVSTSRQAVEMFGLSDMEQYIERFSDLSPEFQPCGTNSDEKAFGYVKEAFRTGGVRFDWLHQTLTGEPMPAEVILERFTRQGKPYVAAFTIDLRPHQAAMERKAEQDIRKRAQAMLNSSPLACFILDENLNVLDLNLETVRLFESGSRQEAIDNFTKAIPMYQPDGALSLIKLQGLFAEMREKGSVRFEWAAQTMKGEEFPCDVFGTAFTVVNVPAAIFHVRDMRDFYKHQAVQAASLAKTNFIANMSHEIRTPMNSILGYAELAQDDEIPEATRGHLRKIITNTKWLLGVISNVLDISKIESGKLLLEKIPFNIGQVVEHCRSLFMAESKAKTLSLSINTDSLKDGGKTRLLGDPTKLSQVLINILSNAVKFTDSGLVSLSITTEESTDDSHTLKFEFKDTGIGMTEEQVSRIFEPFTQADASTTRKYGGTGLGLAITGRLIEAMGGKLFVVSSKGLGSLFSFTLTFPVAKAGTDPVDYYLYDGADIQKPRFDAGEILVVDDNGMNLSVACEHLKRVGLKAFTAQNGMEAVEIVKARLDSGRKPFDLIFMDIHMPEMDGKEAATIISRTGVNTPIIAMTAEALTITDDAPYKEYGMTGYLSKPFTTQELWKCLQKYLS